ncbi:MAG: hypothetical protein H6815_10835 [Phycisphaeraceae bacterium]|nr:hypothetical protein [Phycisphaerales bacterium]MCB9860930.1 hypothetical protein [Phycisphaeraceae bacterium]
MRHQHIGRVARTLVGHGMSLFVCVSGASAQLNPFHVEEVIGHNTGSMGIQSALCTTAKSFDIQIDAYGPGQYGKSYSESFCPPNGMSSGSPSYNIGINTNGSSMTIDMGGGLLIGSAQPSFLLSGSAETLGQALFVIDTYISADSFLSVFTGNSPNSSATTDNVRCRLLGPVHNVGQIFYPVNIDVTWDPAGGGQHQIWQFDTREFLPGRYIIRVEGIQSNVESSANVSIGTTTQFGFASSTMIVPSFSQDIDQNGVVDALDMIAWLANPTDTDGDGTIDAAPYGMDASMLAGVLRAQGNLGADCNLNEYPDEYDIAVGSANGGSADVNMNGIPDECEPCYADCDENTTLTIFDFICFGNAYSNNEPYADCDQNSTFNIFDYICFGNAYAAGCP